MSLADAMDVLNNLSNARALTVRSQLVAGALAFDTAACSDGRDLADTAIASPVLATDGELDLDETSRRAAHLALVISKLMTAMAKQQCVQYG